MTTYSLEYAAQDSRNFAVLAHLASYSAIVLPVVAPLVIPAVMIALRPDDHFAREHAVESLNFQISMYLWGAIFGAASFFLVGLPFLFAIFVAGLVMPAVAAMEASKGEVYRYPCTLRLLS